jgi:hypothetical protein
VHEHLHVKRNGASSRQESYEVEFDEMSPVWQFEQQIKAMIQHHTIRLEVLSHCRPLVSSEFGHFCSVKFWSGFSPLHTPLQL